ncbi:MAG: fibronectin type III domain-containing protein [Archangium sp.]|nr:fibronectin type III domain-containing protein [Archangium sp.]
MTLRLATLCTLLVAPLSLAQTPSLAILRVDDPNLDTYTFGASQCNDTVTLAWSNTLTISLIQCVQNPLKIWSTSGECQDTPGANDKRYDDVPALTVSTVRQGNFSVKLSELPGFRTTATADGGTVQPCGSALTTIEHRVCGSVSYALANGVGGTCGTAMPYPATSLKLIYDTKPPASPTITEYAAQDMAVRLGFTVDSDATVVTMEVQGPTDPDWREIAETAASNGSIRGDGLENNVPYFVRLRARDAAGNVSIPTTELQVTPIRTLGFWGYYKEAGGTEQGGCSVGAGLVPLLLAAFAFRRARKQVRRAS